MPDKFRNRFRVSSARASWWDYGNNGAYFVTICTKNRVHFFGEIHGAQMKPEYGRISKYILSNPSNWKDDSFY